MRQKGQTAGALAWLPLAACESHPLSRRGAHRPVGPCRPYGRLEQVPRALGTLAAWPRAGPRTLRGTACVRRSSPHPPTLPAGHGRLFSLTHTLTLSLIPCPAAHSWPVPHSTASLRYFFLLFENLYHFKKKHWPSIRLLLEGWNFFFICKSTLNFYFYLKFCEILPNS